MNRYYIILLLLLININIIEAQIGINTNLPNGPLDIRVKGGSNQPGLLVTNDGSVIIGKSTSSAEKAKLVVEGTMNIKSGNEGERRFYMVDKSGVADWQEFSLGSKYTYWKLEDQTTGFRFDGTMQVLAGTTSFPVNELGLKKGSDPKNLEIPAGKYLVIATGDVNGNEFGEVFLSYTEGGVTKDIFSAPYFGYLAGTVFYVELANPVTAFLRYKAIFVSGAGSVWTSPIVRTYHYDLIFLKLNQ